MKKSKKSKAIIVLIVLLLALAIGYAAFSSTLTINGTATGTGTWDVKFQSATLKNSEGTTDSTHGTATISGSNSETITATINLAYPGDGVILEAVVGNNGNTPAKLEKFSIDGPESEDIEITQAAPSTNEKLPAGGTCTAQFAIKWKADSTATDLGEQTFTITYEYTQDTTEVNLTPSHTDNNTTN